MVRSIRTKSKPDSSGFFSVRQMMTISAVKYRPAICYPMSGGLVDVVADLVSKDLADTYAEMQIFVSGKATPLSQMTATRLKGTQLSPATAVFLQKDAPATVEIGENSGIEAGEGGSL